MSRLNTQIPIVCLICGKKFKIIRYRKNKAKYCSEKCYSKARQITQQKENNNNWKGGKYEHEEGYILIRIKEHPFASKAGYVMEHRLIMENKLKRFLLPKETVHHINEIRGDNRPENLMLFKNRGQHANYHRKTGEFNAGN